MGSSRRAAGLGMAAGLLAGAVTFGAVAVHAAPQEARPFEGVLEGASQVTGISGGIVSSESAGTIQATHIGNGTYELLSDQDYPRHLEEEHPFGNCAFVEGELVITAADGDELHAHVDGDRSVVCAPDEQGPVPPAPGDVYYSTVFSEVTGGTGRFADATGWLFSEGTSTLGDPASGPTEDLSTIYGDIDY